MSRPAWEHAPHLVDILRVGPIVYSVAVHPDGTPDEAWAICDNCGAVETTVPYVFDPPSLYALAESPFAGEVIIRAREIDPHRCLTVVAVLA